MRTVSTDDLIEKINRNYPGWLDILLDVLSMSRDELTAILAFYTDLIPGTYVRYPSGLRLPVSRAVIPSEVLTPLEAAGYFCEMDEGVAITEKGAHAHRFLTNCGLTVEAPDVSCILSSRLMDVVRREDSGGYSETYVEAATRAEAAALYAKGCPLGSERVLVVEAAEHGKSAPSLFEVITKVDRTVTLLEGK